MNLYENGWSASYLTMMVKIVIVICFESEISSKPLMEIIFEFQIKANRVTFEYFVGKKRRCFINDYEEQCW